MALGELRAFLQRHRVIALDTSIFIYWMEANPRYFDLAGAVFDFLARPNHAAITSTLTMTELLVAPYRVSSQERACDFYALLSAYPHLEWLPPTLEIADIAARARAKHRLHTPGAILAATAIDAGATALITNDSAFDRVEAFETAVLDRYL